MTKVIGDDILLRDLSRLGLQDGDIVYVRSRLSAVGRMRTKDSLLKSIRNAIGANGTIICPAFTTPSFRWSRTKKIFSLDTPSDSGALTKLMLADSASVRSTHPTHSFVAIGPDANEILFGHDSQASAFFPIKKMVERKVNFLLIGCNAESPGFSTVHYVQEQLGLSKRHLSKFLYCIQIEKNGRHIDWRPGEDPGCSRGFDKLYRDYIKAELLSTGWVGNAFALKARADLVYKIDFSRLREDPLAVLCDRPSCVSCRILRGYNLKAAPMAALHLLYEKAKRALSGHARSR